MRGTRFVRLRLCHLHRARRRPLHPHRADSEHGTDVPSDRGRLCGRVRLCRHARARRRCPRVRRRVRGRSRARHRLGRAGLQNHAATRQRPSPGERGRPSLPAFTSRWWLAMIRHLAPVIVLAALGLGCAPGRTAQACIAGTWLGFPRACNSHPWCTAASNPAPECRFEDCVVRSVKVYRPGGTSSAFSIVHSPAQRQFSRPVAASSGTWSVVDGRLVDGAAEASFECSREVLPDESRRVRHRSKRKPPRRQGRPPERLRWKPGGKASDSLLLRLRKPRQRRKARSALRPRGVPSNAARLYVWGHCLSARCAARARRGGARAPAPRGPRRSRRPWPRREWRCTSSPPSPRRARAADRGGRTARA